MRFHNLEKMNRIFIAKDIKKLEYFEKPFIKIESFYNKLNYIIYYRYC